MQGDQSAFDLVSVDRLALQHRGAIKIGPFGSQLRKDAMKAAKSKLKVLHKGFSDRLEAAQAEVATAQAEALVLGILQGDLRRELDRRVVAHRQAVVAAVENWWSKYQVTLGDLEGARNAAGVLLDGFLKELGYAG